MKYKVGMYGGSFNPLHLGHINDIIVSASLCEKLYLMLGVSKDSQEIDWRIRLQWLKNAAADLDNVEIMLLKTNEDTKCQHDFMAGAKQCKQQIGQKIDVVFCGDDYLGKNIWEKCYPESKIHYLPRSEINISSTEIRKTPYRYFNFLPRYVQEFYTKKICIIGGESCGKSTLIRNLAKYFNTAYVEEKGRLICEKAGGPTNMTAQDYYKILKLQKDAENEMERFAQKVLFIDTDALTTLYFFEETFSKGNSQYTDFAQLTEKISAQNKYDLYIFLEPGVKWVQDGTRGDGADSARKKSALKLKNIYNKNNINYICVDGDYLKRYEKCKELVKRLIEK